VVPLFDVLEFIVELEKGTASVVTIVLCLIVSLESEALFTVPVLLMFISAGCWLLVAAELIADKPTIEAMITPVLPTLDNSMNHLLMLRIMWTP
jgi:hypothetical protein